MDPEQGPCRNDQLARPSSRVLLREAEDCDVLLRVTLHHVHQKSPQRRVLDVTDQTPQSLQFLRICLLSL